MKHLKYILALIVAFSLVSTFAFAAVDAATDINVTISDVEYAGGDVTVTLTATSESASSTSEKIVVIYGTFSWDTDVWQYKSKTGSLMGNGKNGTLEVVIDDEAEFKGGEIGTATFSLKEGASAANSSAFTFEELVDYNDNDISFSGGNVTVKKAGTAPVIKEVVVGDTTYTNVATYTGSITNATGTKLSFSLTNGTTTKNYSENLADWGITIIDGTLNFNVAAVGADSNVKLTNASVTD